MRRRPTRPLLASAALAIALLPAVALLAAFPAAARAQEYRSSVVGTDYDFIHDTDPSTFLCLEAKGEGPREMPDKTGQGPLIQQAFIFVAYFDDGTSIDMALDADFASPDAAREEALRYVHRLGKLPTALRRGVERVVVHRGYEDTTAFSDVGLIVLYSANATKRIATHDLEETVFHESVHAAWDKAHAGSPEWRTAQAADGTFITDYARKNPDGEDLAESALFAYTLVHHPDRIPVADAAKIRSAIPARIAYVEALLPPGEPIFRQVGPRYGCDGSGTTFTVAATPAASRPSAADAAAAPGTTAVPTCDVDLENPGELADVLSNALVRGLGQDATRVSAFLDEAASSASSEALLRATVAELGVDRATLDAQVKAYLHCNCEHGELGPPADRETPRPPASAPEPVPPSERRDERRATRTPEQAEETGIRSVLHVIASLLALILAVNVGTLLVLVRSRRDR